jgi:hypothetical protein
MKCLFCGNSFIPSKYRPNQQVCSKPDCQHQRQVNNSKEWRTKNPDYYKTLGQDSAWKSYRNQYSKLWKQSHKDHIKQYHEANRAEKREYMREYMKEYRKKIAENRI